MRFAKRLFFIAGFLCAGQALAACEIFTWKFGISPADVQAIKECGPYKAFKNGDLETYKGVFAGKEENVQFFFDDKRLRRIGVYLYEGNDAQAAGRQWAALGKVMTRYFGQIETPENVDPAQAQFYENALKLVEKPGKTQMAPIGQPKDAMVFASLLHQVIEGADLYNVIIYFDRRQPVDGGAVPAPQIAH